MTAIARTARYVGVRKLRSMTDMITERTSRTSATITQVPGFMVSPMLSRPTTSEAYPRRGQTNTPSTKTSPSLRGKSTGGHPIQARAVAVRGAKRATPRRRPIRWGLGPRGSSSLLLTTVQLGRIAPSRGARTERGSRARLTAKKNQHSCGNGQEDGSTSHGQRHQSSASRSG